MERGIFPQESGFSSSALTASDDSTRRRHDSRMMGGATNAGGQSAKSYYDLYPERKRTGPYIPKPALVDHLGDPCKQSITSGSGSGSIRRCRSGSQLSSQRKDTAAASSRKDKEAVPRQSHAAGNGRSEIESLRRSASSTHVVSPMALGLARPHIPAQQPVKSIDEIVRAHSASLLSVPPSPSTRGPLRSASWSAFEPIPRVHRSSITAYSSQHQAPSDTESDHSAGSVEQETRTILRGARDDPLGRRMSNLSVGTNDSNTTSRHNDARRKSSVGIASSSRTPSRQSILQGTYKTGPTAFRRGLTLCMRIKVAGAPPLQLSFADVGLEHGHPVMVFLGLGASRHLIGLYDEVAASLGLRLICIDRWGIGRTDSVAPEKRNILGWSLVVEKVADLLDIDKFSVLAHSAGAPFAAALGLLFPHRIQGPLHLLSPWKGMQQDSGYRWLRYIPDGVIKTAHAADYRIQNWKLSKEGSRAANRPRSSTASDGRTKARPSAATEIDRAPTPPPKDRIQDRIDSASETGSRLSRDTTGSSSDGMYVYQEAATRHAVEASRSALAHELEADGLMESQRDDARDLLKASHSESARGLVDDLNIVLGKRPWGFGYADVHLACEVWHGSKDERIPLSSSISLAKEMSDCVLHIVDGASHSLMTNTNVILEVFESIREHANR